MTNAPLTQSESKKSLLAKAVNLLRGSSDDNFSAAEAWVMSTYGTSAPIDVDTRIREKRCEITNSIKSKFTTACQPTRRYFSIVDIPVDLAAFADDIFEPFRLRGFRICNLHECLPDIFESGLYGIGWYHAFNDPADISSTVDTLNS